MVISFGDRLRGLREDSDLTQAQLAKKLHMTQRKISYMECGKSEPGMDDIVAICRFFGVSSDYLLGLRGSRRLS